MSTTAKKKRLRDTPMQRAVREAVNKEFDALLGDLEKLVANVPPSLDKTAATLRTHFKRLVESRRLKPGQIAAWCADTEI